MSLELEINDPRISEVEIVEFEQEFAPLPEDYRQYMLKYNGGEPKVLATFDFQNGEVDGGSVVGYFLSLGTERNNLIIRNRTVRADEEEYGEEEGHDLAEIDHDSFIIIGYDKGSNDIWLGVQGDVRGKVYLHDEFYPQLFFEVAPSFQSFLESFRSMHDGD